MGERSKDALRLDPCTPGLKVEFNGTKVTGDPGLLAYRELDEVLGLTTMTESGLTDSRTGKNTQVLEERWGTKSRAFRPISNKTASKAKIFDSSR